MRLLLPGRRPERADEMEREQERRRQLLAQEARVLAVGRAVEVVLRHLDDEHDRQ